MPRQICCDAVFTLSRAHFGLSEGIVECLVSGRPADYCTGWHLSGGLSTITGLIGGRRTRTPECKANIVEN